MVREKSSKNVRKKKENLLFMLLVIFLIATIACISSFGLATWARYISKDNGIVDAEIARWNFKVNGQSKEFANINLADTISFNHVEDTRIAPGTYGEFDLNIDGRGSDVSIDYYIDIDVTNKPTNLNFYLDESHTKKIAVENNVVEVEGDLLLADEEMQRIETIYWGWDYETTRVTSYR